MQHGRGLVLEEGRVAVETELVALLLEKASQGRRVRRVTLIAATCLEWRVQAAQGQPVVRLVVTSRTEVDPIGRRQLPMIRAMGDVAVETFSTRERGVYDRVVELAPLILVAAKTELVHLAGDEVLSGLAVCVMTEHTVLACRVVTRGLLEISDDVIVTIDAENAGGPREKRRLPGTRSTPS